MGAAAGDEEEGKGKSPEAFAVGGPRQPSHHLAAVGDRGQQPSIR